MKALQNNVELSACRVSVVENQNLAAKEESENLRKRIDQLQRELVKEQRRCEKLESENARKDRANQVVIASKFHERAESNRLQQELIQAQGLINHLESVVKELEGRLDEYENTNNELKITIQNFQEKEELISNRFKMQKADLASQELMITKLNNRIAQLESAEKISNMAAGLGKKKSSMFIDVNQEEGGKPRVFNAVVDYGTAQLKRSEAQNATLKKQLDDALIKISELSSTIEEMQQEPLFK